MKFLFNIKVVVPAHMICPSTCFLVSLGRILSEVMESGVCLFLISIKWRSTKNSFWYLDFKFIFAVMFIYVYYQNVQAIAVSGRFITACHPTAPRSCSAWGHAGHEGSRLWWASSNTWWLVLAAALLEGSARGGNAGSKVSDRGCCGAGRWAGWAGRITRHRSATRCHELKKELVLQWQPKMHRVLYPNNYQGDCCSPGLTSYFIHWPQFL